MMRNIKYVWYVFSEENTPQGLKNPSLISIHESYEGAEDVRKRCQDSTKEMLIFSIEGMELKK